MPKSAALTAATALTPTQGAPQPLPSVSASTTYHRIEIDGLGLFYREAGPREAPTILLLHGYPSSSRQWDPLLPLLADRYHLIAPDYPGFGRSDAPSPAHYAYTFDALARTMEGLVERLGIERYALFLQDYGGPVGFRMALAHPERVSALIVQNANAYAEGLGPKWEGMARYWADPAAHPEQVDAFTSLEGARQRHLGTSPNPERYNPDSWTDEYAVLSRPGMCARSRRRFSTITAPTSRPTRLGRTGCAATRCRRWCCGAATIPRSSCRARKPTDVICRGPSFTSSMPATSRSTRRPTRSRG